MKITVEKNGKEAQYFVGLVYYEEEKTYYATAFDMQKKELGFLSFTLLNNVKDAVWMYQIYVNNDHRGQLVGTALLTCLQTYCIKNNKSVIMGKFVPENEKSESFYIKNDFAFQNEWLNTMIIKKVDFEKKDEILSRVKNYDVLTKRKDNLNKEAIKKDNASKYAKQKAM